MVVTYYPPHRTGLSLHVQRIAEALVARGHVVTVLTSRFRRDLPRDEVRNGVRIVRLRPFARVSRGQVMPGFPLAFAQLVAEHDVVSLHTPMLETLLAAAIARLYRRRLVITHHGDLVLPSGVLNRLIERVVELFFGGAAVLADQLIAYTDDYACHSHYLKGHLHKTSAVLPPASVGHPEAQGVEQVRAGIGSGPIVGYAGRFVEEKRPDLLLQAIDLLLPEFPGLQVVFAGQYRMPYERYYERCLPLIERHSERVHFLDLIQQEQALADFYAACDVLVLPSDTECFGLVQVEAMLCGTPVVATNIPGARVPVQMSGMGELATSDDPHALAAAIARVLAEPARYQRSRGEIESIFCLAATVDGYEAVLRA